MSAIEKLAQFDEQFVHLPNINDFPVVGVHEYFARQIPQHNELTNKRRFIGLQVAMHLTSLGVFDSTPRVYGATEQDELLVFPHYKPRTMPRIDAEKRAEIEREIQLGLRGKDEDNAERTKFGLWLARKSLDDLIPFPILIGMHGFYGNVRPIMPAELFSYDLIEAAGQLGLGPMDIAKRMQPGYATTYAYLGARTWDANKLVEAVTLPNSMQPSRGQLIGAIASKEFRQKTGSLPTK